MDGNPVYQQELGVAAAIVQHSEEQPVGFLSCSLIWRGLQPGLACTGTLICFL